MESICDDVLNDIFKFFNFKELSILNQVNVRFRKLTCLLLDKIIRKRYAYFAKQFQYVLPHNRRLYFVYDQNYYLRGNIIGKFYKFKMKIYKLDIYRLIIEDISDPEHKNNGYYYHTPIPTTFNTIIKPQFEDMKDIPFE
jgi:hypothetical protein